METNNVVLIGGGGHARVVLDCLLAEGRMVHGVFDTSPAKEAIFGVPRIGDYQPESFADAGAIIAIGDNSTRARLSKEITHAFTNATHPSAIVSRFSHIGVGNMILHGSIIQAQTQVGDHVIINTGAQVDHDNIIESYVHIGPRSALCGSVTVGEGAFVGAGVTIPPGITIGKWSVIGAGAVVIRDIPDYAVAVGNPARVIRFIKKMNQDG